jgi:hypothetical protein
MGNTVQAKQSKYKVSLWLTLGLCLLFSSLTTAFTPSVQTVLDTDTLIEPLADDESDSCKDSPALIPGHPVLDAGPTLLAIAPNVLLMPYVSSEGSGNSPRGPPLLF